MWGRGGEDEGRGAERGPEKSLTDRLKSGKAGGEAPAREAEPPPPLLPPRQGQWPGPAGARAGGAVAAAHASRVGGGGGSSASSGAAPPGEAPAAPAVRSGFAPRLRRSCAKTGSLRSRNQPREV